jgi:3-oxoacyl-[acyl-carrier-protein] synthase I
MNMKNRVVVTGLGIVASNACGIVEFSEAIKKGKSGIQHVDELERLNFSCQVAGIPDFPTDEQLQLLDKYHLAEAGMNTKYSVVAAHEAWHDAGLQVPEIDGNTVNYDTGVIIGSGVGNIDVFTNNIVPVIDKGKVRKLRSNIAEFTMFSAASANLEWIFALGNQVSSNSSACSTGTESVILGVNRILNGKANRMMVGACEIPSPYVWGCFDSMRILSRGYNDHPEKASRPMSASASGFVPAAGAGILILEDYQTALERGAKIYGEIIGTALNSGGQRNGGTMQAPGALGVQRCISEAMNDAGITGNDIDLICGHLSSTMADPLEIKNWTEVLQRKGDQFPYINSLKSITGHGLGAAGVFELIAAFVQLNEQFIHPSLNCEDIHPEIAKLISIEKIPNDCYSSVSLNTIAKASFGFGDLNSCVIISKIK